MIITRRQATETETETRGSEQQLEGHDLVVQKLLELILAFAWIRTHHLSVEMMLTIELKVLWV